MDAVRPLGTERIRCSQCRRMAVRQSVYAQAIYRPDRKLPGRDFAEASEMLESHRAELEQREGQHVPSPALWLTAQARAKHLLSQGATSSADVR